MGQINPKEVEHLPYTWSVVPAECSWLEPDEEAVYIVFESEVRFSRLVDDIVYATPITLKHSFLLGIDESSNDYLEYSGKKYFVDKASVDIAVDDFVWSADTKAALFDPIQQKQDGLDLIEYPNPNSLNAFGD